MSSLQLGAAVKNDEQNLEAFSRYGGFARISAYCSGFIVASQTLL